MSGNCFIQNFSFGSHSLQLYIPVTDHVRDQYEKNKGTNASIAFPYWAQVWPAAIGLCRFLNEQPDLMKEKIIRELGAGLGLPSLFASHFAKQVIAIDHSAEAVSVMQQSVRLNGIDNMDCILLDWNHLPTSLSCDTLLVSDINYEPAAFENIYAVLKNFLAKGTTIVLSTPQRLMAKPFIERLLPFCVLHHNEMADTNNGPVAVTIVVLKKDGDLT